MKDNDKNKLLMYEAVFTYLIENTDIISTNSAFLNSISQLRKAIDELKLKNKAISSSTLEKTLLANKAKDELIATLLPISNSLFLFAVNTGDFLLKENTRLSQSYLNRLMDTELINKSFTVQKYAFSKIAYLYKFGLTKRVIQELSKKIDFFKSALFDKSISFISGNSGTELNDSLLNVENILINQLDKLMEPFFEEHEDFYNDYLSIRSGELITEYEEESVEMEMEE